MIPFAADGNNDYIDNSQTFTQELRNAPDLAYNLLARYRHKLPDGSEMTYQMDFRHKDQVNQDPDNLEFASIPEYDVADARTAWSEPEHRSPPGKGFHDLQVFQ